MSTPDLSIVTTLYRSEPYIQEFYRRVSAAAADITTDFEILFVNDGSPDGSLEVAVDLCRQDPRVKVVDLSRNFGHHRAAMTGLAQARGKLVFLIDCDLEIPPELLTDFHRKFREEGADVIYGVQDERQDPAVSRFLGKLFYTAMNWLSSDTLPRNLTMTRLMSRRYVSNLLLHREREVPIAGLWVITGFQQVPLTIRKEWKGESTYDVPRKIALLVRAITSFSNKPLVLIFYLGMFISFVAFAGALVIVIRRMYFGVMMTGWPSVVVSIWFLGGVILLCLGVIGIYVSKIFVETKQRPYTIIRQIYPPSDDENENLESA